MLENKNGQQPSSYSSSSLVEQIPAAGALEAALTDCKAEARRSFEMQQKQLNS